MCLLLLSHTPIKHCPMTLSESLKIAESAHQQKQFEVAEKAYLKIINNDFIQHCVLLNIVIMTQLMA